MSFGCNIADQHHCIQVADKNIADLLDSLKIDYSSSVLVCLPQYSSKISLATLLGFQSHSKIILIVEAGKIQLVDDLQLNRNIQVVVMPNAELSLTASFENNADYNFHLQNSSKLNFDFKVEQACNIGLELNCNYGSSASVKGVYDLENSEAVCIKTSQNHLEKDATSNLLVKGILSGNAQVEYFGNIFVAERASGTVVLQKNKTLILSSSAKALSTPSMEVLNKDVQCAHGAAVSYIQEEQLFYLQSRGLEGSSAIEMLKESFLV